MPNETPAPEPLFAKDQYYYLEGPKSRSYELLFAFDVLWEFIKGFRKLHFVGPCVTVFGSARFKEGHAYYELSRKLGARIAQEGLTVMTGGGPGVMEAANRGAFEVGGKSVGCNIKLPHEQFHNPYMQKWVTIKYFFVRKVLLIKYSYAFVVMPGGVGTLDELFETLTLIQTATIHDFPLVVMGKDYHAPLIAMLNTMVKEATIAPEDLELLKFTDDVEEAVAHIRTYLTKNYRILPRRKPLGWLWEKA
ncbi:TIGR00730 family Rossman fold protein [Rhabdobacter roseus]|uniref:Cytokinin riboside 5'-monophosphate phosphoribohydrolase n=1 Tax=Rhabdobacter roseus TaxID=1655419 RepID=A0A840TPC6_9BACT|nr:TIGR00730 family Rossman fold protein [Rhabdobacter roseus]MBB5285204.1 hypothetical protein [Rhabdobacter roseus]